MKACDGLLVANNYFHTNGLDKKGQLMVFHISSKKYFIARSQLQFPSSLRMQKDWVTFHCAFWTWYRFWWLIISASNHKGSHFSVLPLWSYFTIFILNQECWLSWKQLTRTCAKWPRIVDLEICSRPPHPPWNKLFRHMLKDKDFLLPFNIFLLFCLRIGLKLKRSVRALERHSNVRRCQFCDVKKVRKRPWKSP